MIFMYGIAENKPFRAFLYSFPHQLCKSWEIRTHEGQKLFFLTLFLTRFLDPPPACNFLRQEKRGLLRLPLYRLRNRERGALILTAIRSVSPRHRFRGVMASANLNPYRMDHCRRVRVVVNAASRLPTYHMPRDSSTGLKCKSLKKRIGFSSDAQVLQGKPFYRESGDCSTNKKRLFRSLTHVDEGFTCKFP